MRKKAVPAPEAEPATVEPDVTSGEPATLKLESNLDLTKASILAKSLMAARGAELTVDASEVRHLGAQCGQILVSAKSTWAGDEQPLRIVDGSAEFIEGARLLGLRSALLDEDATL